MQQTIISLKNVDIGFHGSPILNKVDLEIRQGENLAIVGAASSGKTSLLNAIAGNVQIRKGTITLKLVDGVVDQRKAIAFVGARHHFRNLSNTPDLYYQQRFNSTDSDDALTVIDYLSIAAAGRTSLSDDHITSVVRLLHLQQLQDKQLIKLSNGETKRLMIAAALLKKPQLLLLDAPLNGLDTRTRAELNDILEQISLSGTAIVIATALHEIPAVVTHIALLKEGRLALFEKDKFSALADDSALPHSPIHLNGLIDKYPVPAVDRIVSMRNVNITYGEKLILNGVNWEIKQGERWALLGPNGAGKSTLLSLINGDNPQAYANDIVLFDKKRGSGESIWDIKKRTGFISPELFQYFPADTSCLHAIESGYYDTMGLFRPSDPNKAERALKWMDTLSIAQYSRQLLKNIPASAQRLCLLARAMIKCPTLLILDEPTQGMDATQINDLKSLIDTICNVTNITIICVTHYEEHLPNSIDHLLRLVDGKVVECCKVNAGH